MAQPNFQIRSDAVAALAQQLELMPNLPAVNLGGQLLQIQNILQKIQQQQGQQGQQLIQQGQQLAQIRQEISRSLLNSSVTRSGTRLEGLRDLNNQPVQGFPETGAAIGELTGHELNALLGQLGLPTCSDGNVSDRKRRFTKYISLLSNLI